jgi:thiamine biosynthesis lipoprotein
MSCDASVIVVTTPTTSSSEGRGADLARCAVGRLQRLEQRWSRFLSDSEISSLNDAEGEPLKVSGDTTRLVTGLVQAWQATDGSFDPTLLGALVDLGYESSRDDHLRRTSLIEGIRPQGDPADILIDATADVIQLPAGTALDPGGLGKGLAADIVVEELLDAGAAGALVEIGGDLRLSGLSPDLDHDVWTVAIAEPGTDQSRLVQLQDGGVATSTSRRRTWTVAGERRHHLITPSTLLCADTGTVSCSVIAGTAAWAEAFTKVAFVEPLDTALDLYHHRGLAASIATDDGHFHDSPAWKEFAR